MNLAAEQNPILPMKGAILGVMKTPIEFLAARFWPKVDISGGPDACWPWRAAMCSGGYGRIMFARKVRKAHRIAWELARGPIPEGDGWHGICVLHRCDNRACCNPSHLFLGTQTENIHDMIAKGRRVNPESSKTHCPAGHGYTPENTYRHDGQRHCIACTRTRTAEWYHRNRRRTA